MDVVLFLAQNIISSYRSLMHFQKRNLPSNASIGEHLKFSIKEKCLTTDVGASSYYQHLYLDFVYVEVTDRKELEVNYAKETASFNHITLLSHNDRRIVFKNAVQRVNSENLYNLHILLAKHPMRILTEVIETSISILVID